MHSAGTDKQRFREHCRGREEKLAVKIVPKESAQGSEVRVPESSCACTTENVENGSKQVLDGGELRNCYSIRNFLLSRAGTQNSTWE